ncbi:hypothetical protein COU49_01925 [Candidatus Nomurabacteria bacterium CG10_big_fil_rev_8_21_14_0_10_35_16]|uniref:Transcobalamin-like C-terminal domain-containing protein n=1 Tax=Candidatus Nomurabacteria bacterium CG10_big_fil_rev_8_21_14_0_10_35_16 TaxID=1974731 RepID=A0A2H0TBC0_9BACT|nr:MAG: hypothetical protein COU49_01925 [Candidatus Nomurabacteria bacterium CG10_big_fil_rev_8_21_14_0_10_35_16]
MFLVDEFMNKKQYKIIFLLSFIFLITFFVFLNIYKRVTPATLVSHLVDEADAQTETISIILTFGDKTLNLSFNQGMSLYEIFTQAQEKGEIDFSGRKYPGLGFFVTEIGHLRHGVNDNLMYFVNGEEAEVGVSSYVPEDGDIINWQLK